MKTVRFVKGKARLQETKSFGLSVIDYTNLVNGRPVQTSYGTFDEAEKAYEAIIKKVNE